MICLRAHYLLDDGEEADFPFYVDDDEMCDLFKQAADLEARTLGLKPVELVTIEFVENEE